MALSLLQALAEGVHAAATTSASIVACPTTSDGLSANSCSNKLVVETWVGNGLNETEPLDVAIDSVDDCRDDDASCTRTTLQNDVVMTLTRTPVYFKYPTAYHSTVNYQKYELTVRSSNVVAAAAAATAAAIVVHPHVAPLCLCPCHTLLTLLLLLCHACLS